MKELVTEVVYIRAHVKEDGLPTTKGRVFTDLGELMFNGTTFSRSGKDVDGIKWFLRPKLGLFLSRGELDTCGMDRIIIPTKIPIRENK